MAHVISITSPIKNSGKTTTAINLAVSLAILEKNTLLVDCDPGQGVSAGTSLLTSPPASPGFYSVMTDQASIGSAIARTSLSHFKILSGGADFSKTDFLFGDTDGDVYKFKELIKGLKTGCDYIIVNSPLDMPNLLKTVLVASDWMVIPLNTDFASPKEFFPQFSGIRNLFKLVLNVREQFQSAPKIAGILLNQCDQMDDLSDKFSIPVLENISEFILSTRIPYSQALSEGFALGKPAAVQNIMSDGASAFLNLAVELMEKTHSHK